MAYLDDYEMYCKCDRCKKEFHRDLICNNKNYSWPLLCQLYKKRRRPNIGDFCMQCADEVAPLLYALRDIDELEHFNFKLNEVINEKRNRRN